jgi:hypothetical protein
VRTGNPGFMTGFADLGDHLLAGPTVPWGLLLLRSPLSPTGLMRDATTLALSFMPVSPAVKS